MHWCAFSALTPLVGRPEEHPACKNFGVGVVICLERGAHCLHVVQLMPLPPQNPIISYFYRTTACWCDKSSANTLYISVCFGVLYLCRFHGKCKFVVVYNYQVSYCMHLVHRWVWTGGGGKEPCNRWRPGSPREATGDTNVHKVDQFHSKYIGWQWRNFVPYLCQLVFAAFLWVKLLEMFVTLLSLNTLWRYVSDHVDIFLNWLVKFCLNKVVKFHLLTQHITPSYTHKMANVSWPWIPWRHFTLCIRC